MAYDAPCMRLHLYGISSERAKLPGSESAYPLVQDKLPRNFGRVRESGFFVIPMELFVMSSSSC